jgi:EmrB/QacA subfamily drug resistance transporter
MRSTARATKLDNLPAFTGKNHEEFMATTTLSSGEQAERIDYAAILPGRTKAIILVGVLLGLFLAALDQTIVATALPAIITDLNGLDLLAWVSTGYLLASTAMVPIYGKLSDLYGRRIILLWGILVFLAGSMLCGIAGSMIQLIIYRVIQGIGAAALTSTAFAIPADLFAPAERARYMGIFGAVFGLSSVLGPYLGGLLTDNWSWRWVFYVNLPIGLVALAFIILKMPKLASGLRAPIDWLGTVLLIAGVVPLLLALTLDKSVHGWTSPLILGLFAVSALATILFLFVEARVPSPIIALKLFRNRVFTVTIVSSVLNGAAFFGAILFLSLFMVNVLGVSATAAGTALIPLTLSLVVGSVLSSFLVQRVGRYKPIILVGFAIMLLGFFLLWQMTAGVTRWGVTWRMIVLGFGIGPALPLLNLALQNAVPFQEVGSATASRQFFQQLGQAFGAAIFGVILTTTLTAQITANLEPIVAQLPPQLQSRFDPAQFRQSSAGSEGAAGSQIGVGEQITTEITAQFEQQRTLLTAALQDNDPQAQATLLENPQTPPALKGLLQAGGDEQTRVTALQQALAGIDTAETQAVAQGQKIGSEITLALRQSFAASITHIYLYAMWLVGAAFLLILFGLPELPLRTSNSGESSTPVFE